MLPAPLLPVVGERPDWQGKLLHIVAGSSRSLWRFPLRSGLAALSVMLGVGGVICAGNYAAEGRLKALNQIQSLGVNTLVITPQQSRSVGGRAKTGAIVTTLVARDYAQILYEVPGIERSSATAASSFMVKAGDLSKNGCVVMGVESGYFSIRQWRVALGDLFDETAERRAARVAVLGATVARDLFGDESPIGRRVFINRVPFQVLGVMAERGQGLDATNEDNQVYVPLGTAKRRLMNVDYFSSLIFEMRDWAAMDNAARDMASLLRRNHHAAANQTGDFQIQNQKSLVETEMIAAKRLSVLVRWAGLTTLAVCGLGILAIAWISVKERTREIGTRRALGATEADIFLQFLTESAIVSITGAAAGWALGWQGTIALAERSGMPYLFERTSGMEVTVFSILLNIALAVLPSREAARLNPIQSLKAE
jgi:putative ABC transport system permease protein